MIVDLYITPHEGVFIPEGIEYKGSRFRLLSQSGARITIELNEDLTIRDHLEAIRSTLSVEVSKEKPVIVQPVVEFVMDSDDLNLRKTLDKPVWQSVFKKPEPVMDLAEWSQSATSDNFVYLPNTMRSDDSQYEEAMHNGYVTEVLVNAYKRMCYDKNINPTILLQNGTRIQARHLQPSHGLQAMVGNRAGRLANSKLDDFDDSEYAGAFIHELIHLAPHLYESKPVHRRVLAKVEHILLGKSSHIYNQKFIGKFFERAEITQNDQAEKLLSVLKAMVIEGLVLEDSETQFHVKMRDCGMGDDALKFLRVYKAIKNGE